MSDSVAAQAIRPSRVLTVALALASFAGGLLLLSLALAEPRKRAVPPPTIASAVEQADVMNALIDQVFLKGGSAAKTALLANETVRFCENVDGPCGPRNAGIVLSPHVDARIPMELRLQFLEANGSSVPTGAPMHGSARAISNAELHDALLSNDNWQALSKTYPGGAFGLEMSRVVLTEDRRTALVHVANYCGFWCGEGRLFMLQNETKAGWLVVVRARMWVS